MFDNIDIIITNNTNKINFLRQNNKLQNIKIYTYNEFLSLYFFSYDNKTIYYIMNNYHIIYEISKIFLDNLYYIDDQEYKNNKLSFLQSLKKELLNNNLLYHNPLFNNYLKNKNILLYDLPKSKELEYLSKSLSKIANVTYQDTKSKTYEHTINELSTSELEVAYIANQICELVKNNIPLSNIYLTNLNPEYRQLIKRIFPMFNIPFTLNIEESIYSTYICTKFFENYNSNLETTISILKEDITNEQTQNIINKIITIINKYTFEEDKLKVKDMIKYELQHTKLEQEDIIDSIHETNLKEHIFNDDEYVFILGFNEGHLPVIHKDELYLTDNDKQELSISYTVDLNNLERTIITNKILSIKNLTITYPLLSNGEELTISSLNDTFNYEVIKIKEVSYLYSNLYNQITLTSLLDNFYKYGTTSDTLYTLNNTYTNLPYNTYDNRFTNINTSILNYLNNKLVLSYTSLDKYFKCPFSYYISKILKLDIYEETFEILIGTLFHSILEKHNTLSFDELWENELANLNREFSPKEQFFLTKLKEELKFIIETINEQENLTNLHNELHEEKITVDISDTVSFTGIIDKVKYSETKQGKIAAIIDYKTGNPNLDLTTCYYGIGMQLPIYLYLSKYSQVLKDSQIAGFYLQKILNNEINVDNVHTYEELKKKNLLLQGFSNNDLSILSEFDLSYTDSKMIKSMKVKQDGDLAEYSKKKTLSNKQMSLLIDLVSKHINECKDGILDCKFDISPKKIGDKEYGCNFCQFKDICYHTNKDYINLEEKTLEDIIGGE